MEIKDLETVLYEFAQELEHTREMLAKYASRYPDYVEELTDLAFEMRLAQANELETDESPKDFRGKAAWQEFASSGSSEKTRAARTTLASHFRGPAFVDLSSRLEMPQGIIDALRDRRVDPATIPAPIVGRIALATSIDEREVRQYFDQPPQLMQAAEFGLHSDTSGTTRMSFAQLVADTPMSEQERISLLK